MCYAIGFIKDMINSLLTKKEAIRCNGKIYSEEHKRKFEIKNDTFKGEKSSVDDNKLVLTINRQPIGEWFKEQWEKLRRGLQQQRKNQEKVEDLECESIKNRAIEQLKAGKPLLGKGWSLCSLVGEYFKCRP